jgi:hypothetical protein
MTFNGQAIDVEVKVKTARASLELTRAMLDKATGELGVLADRAREKLGDPPVGGLHEALDNTLRLIEEARDAAGRLPESDALPLLEGVADLSDDLDDLTQQFFGQGRRS